MVRCNSLLKSVKKKGSGLVNTSINKLPIELHIPGYNFCGPGTKLNFRLQRGDKGVNLLDEACKEHDIAYSESDNLTKRHQADKILYQRALDRAKSKGVSIGEKLAAVSIAGIMKAKTTLGMGVGMISGLLKGVGKRKVSRKKRSKLRKQKLSGAALTFLQAMKKARNAIRRNGKNKGVYDNAKIAYQTLKKLRRSGKISPPRSRVIPIPKQGGFLPLVPIFAALGALGSLGGGAAAIAKAVNDAKAAKEQLEEAKRHNLTMEAKTVGSGLYIKPYKSGCGLYLSTATKNG